MTNHKEKEVKTDIGRAWRLGKFSFGDRIFKHVGKGVEEVTGAGKALVLYRGIAEYNGKYVTVSRQDSYDGSHEVIEFSKSEIESILRNFGSE